MRLKQVAQKSLGFIGVSLAGGKTEKTATAYLEYYPEQDRLFLSELQSKVLFDEGIGGDDKLIQWLNDKRTSQSLVFDVPISLPPCLQCTCANDQGPMFCMREDVQWMHEKIKDREQRPFKPITPYTQRAIDLFLSDFESKKFEVGHALGSNLAPLTARALFIKKRSVLPVFETSPKVSSYQLGLNFGVAKSYLQTLYSSTEGEESRRIFLQAWIERSGIFIYKQDLRHLTENLYAFNSFLSAYMGFLVYKNLNFELPSLFCEEKVLLPKPW